VTYRAGSATAVLVVSAVVAVALLLDAAVRGGVPTALLLAPWVLLLLWGVYVTSFASHVRTDADGITVQNLLRRTRVPWAEVEDISFHLQLRIHTRDGRRITCWGGPAAARPPRRPLAGSPDARVPAPMRDLDRILEAWESAREAGSGSGDVVRAWDVPAVVCGAILVILAVSASISVGAGG
jgi:hypothetical protein